MRIKKLKIGYRVYDIQYPHYFYAMSVSTALNMAFKKRGLI